MRECGVAPAVALHAMRTMLLPGLASAPRACVGVDCDPVGVIGIPLELLLPHAQTEPSVSCASQPLLLSSRHCSGKTRSTVPLKVVATAVPIPTRRGMFCCVVLPIPF